MLTFKFKNQNAVKAITALNLFILTAVLALFGFVNSTVTDWDYLALDFFHRQAVKSGYGPEISDKIALVRITSETQGFFLQGEPDRVIFAKVNDVLSRAKALAVAYDRPFKNPANSYSDREFEKSLARLRKVYLPIEISVKTHFPLEKKNLVEQRLKRFLRNPIEKGSPVFTKEWAAILPRQAFLEKIVKSGHGHAGSDSGGIYRRVPLLIKFESGYLPALSLSIFLDYVRVPVSEIVVDWGNQIQIPIVKGSLLQEEVRIPIDGKGQTYIPFAQFWDGERASFISIPLHSFMSTSDGYDSNARATRSFENKFVFVQSAATTVKTALEDNAPLASIHANLLNAMLTKTFYREWTRQEAMILLGALGILFGFLALFESPWIFYSAAAALPCFLLGLGWLAFVNFSLLPVSTVAGGAAFILTGLAVARKAARKYCKPDSRQAVLEELSITGKTDEERDFIDALNDNSEIKWIEFLERYPEGKLRGPALNLFNERRPPRGWIKKDAFISYRRDGGGETALLFKKELKARGYFCFLDMDDLPGGAGFDKKLYLEIKHAPSFILIISPGSLDRCGDEDDYMRKEIRWALSLGKNIIPVLKDCGFPARESLPDVLAELTTHNAVLYSHAYFDAALEKLIKFLNQK